MKFLKYFTITFLSLLLISIGVIFIGGKYYEKEVKSYIVEQINQNLTSKVKVGDIDLTLIEKFPFAALKFSDLIIYEPGSDKELLNSSKVYLQFNILNILKKDYTIRKIEIKKGALNLRIFKNGKDNFHIWKESNNTDSRFKISLNNVQLKGLRIKYSNEILKQVFDVDGKSIELKGEFAEKEYSLSSTAQLFVHKISTGDIIYLKEKEADLDFDFNVKDDIYTIAKGLLSLEELDFSLAGRIINKNDTKELDLNLKGIDLNINSFLSLLPKEFAHNSDNYKSDGEFTFNTSIKGTLSKVTNPEIKADFLVNNATITEKESGISLTNLYLKGDFSNGKNKNLSSNKLHVKEFKTSLRSGKISGSFTIEDFNNPKLKLNTTANFGLAELLQFFNNTTFTEVNGNVVAAIEYSGDLKSAKKITTEYPGAGASGNIEFTNVSFNTVSKKDFKNINGSLSFKNKDVQVNALSGAIGQSDFNFTGLLQNFIPYVLLENNNLLVEGQLNSNYINIQELLTKETEEDKATDSVNKKTNTIDYNIIANIEKTTYKSFKAEKINGQVAVSNGNISTPGLAFKTMNGDIELKGSVNKLSEEQYELELISKAEKLNITQLFIQLDEFGQDILQSKNINGIASADMQMSALCGKDMKIIPASLKLISNVKIENGELKEFQPLYKLSKFIELSELKNIKFTTLQNRIEISNELITIPKMEIGSNALNLTFAGTHSFENNIDYHMKLSLNELLSQKAKKAKKENEEFGTIEDDGLGRFNIFVTMKGNMSDPVIKYDKSGLKQKLKEDILTEKQNLRSIFKDEFGWYKSDTTLKAKAKKKEQPLGIEWEEIQKPKSTETKVVEKNNGNNSKFKTKFAKEEKEELSGETSDDFN